MNRILLMIVLMGLPSLCSAEWMVDAKSSQKMYASTYNDSGNIFGQYCLAEERSCMYLIGLTTACEAGSKYPVLANSDTGATVHQIYCNRKVQGTALYEYIFLNFEDINKVVRASSKIGFAMPLEGDQFKVIRFDISNAPYFLDLMRSAADKKFKLNYSGKDQIL